MQISIEHIKIKNRIRENMGDIEKLAESIKKHGLLQPIVVTPDNVLIVGERRIKAVTKLGATCIEARIMELTDFEQQLQCEIDENECRKEFTFEERVKYGRELEQIEKLKAEERKLSTLKQNANTVREKFPAREYEGRVRDIVAAKVGFGSGKQYEKVKTIVDESPEPIKELVKTGEISINKSYEATKIINQLPEPEKKEVIRQVKEHGKIVVDEMVKAAKEELTPFQHEVEEFRQQKKQERAEEIHNRTPEEKELVMAKNFKKLVERLVNLMHGLSRHDVETYFKGFTEIEWMFEDIKFFSKDQLDTIDVAIEWLQKFREGYKKTFVDQEQGIRRIK